MVYHQIQKEAEKQPIGYARYELLLDESGSPYDARFLEVNPGFVTYFGKNLEELQSTSKFELYADFYKGSEQEWLEAYYRVAYEGDSFIRIVQYADADMHFELNVYSPQKGQFITLFQNASSRQKNDELYRQVLENMSDSVFITSLEGDFKFICPNAHFIFGYDEQAIREQGNISALIGQDYKKALENAVIDNSEDLVKNLEQTVVDKDGEMHHLLIDIKAVDLFGGKLLFVCRDITSRRFYENRFKEIIAQAPYGIALVADDGTPYMVNPMLCKMLEYDESELMHMPFKEFTHPADFDEDMERYAKLVKHEIDRYTVVKRYITKSGKVVHANLVVCLIDDPSAQGGKRALAMVEDITANIRSQLRYETLINTAGDPIYVLNELGEILEVNEAAMKMTGYGRNEMVGKFMGLINKNYPSKETFRQMADRLTPGSSVLKETSHTTKLGREVPIEMNIRTTQLLGERMYFAIARDLTNRYEQEHRLKENNDQLKESQRIAKLGSWTLNVPENVLEWSDEIYRIFGEEPQAFEGTVEAFYDFVHPEEREQVQDYFNQCVTEKKDYHLVHRIITGKGEEKVVEENAHFSYDRQDEMLIAHGTVQDITDRIAYQNKLARQVQQLQMVLEQGGLIAFEADLDTGDIHLLRDLGDIPLQLFPKNKLSNWDSFVSTFRPEDALHCARKTEQLKQGEIDSFDCLIQVKTQNRYTWLEGNLARLEPNQRKKNSVFVVLKDVQEEKDKETLELIGQEKERLRIARDIHDSIGQLLVGTRLMLKTRGDNELMQTIETVDEMLSEMIKESRIIINNFGISLEKSQNLKSAFEELMAKMKRVFSGEFEFVWEGSSIMTDLKKATHIFRIYQEALANAIKYAEANSISVVVENQNNQFYMEIADNGEGFDMNEITAGFGIENIKQRAEAIGAKVMIESGMGEGTSVRLKLGDT